MRIGSRESRLWLFVLGTRMILAVPLCLAVLPSNLLSQQQDETLDSVRTLIQEGKNPEAIAQLNSLAEHHPGMKGLSRELGVAYYNEGEFLDAAKHLEKALQEDAEDHDAAQLLGLSYYSVGKPDQAIQPLEKVLLWHPNENIDAIYILGLCYTLTKNYPRALETFARLYHLDPDSASAHLLLSRILLRQGFDPIAEQEVLKVLSLSPRLPLAHFTLGEFYVYKADYARAAREFEEEMEINPGYAPAANNLGDVYWRLKRFDDAYRILQGSIWLDSTSAAPYVVLGKVYIAKRQLHMAERTLRRAVALEPGSYSAHYFLGQVYLELGNKDTAAREFKTAAQIQQRETQEASRIR